MLYHTPLHTEQVEFKAPPGENVCAVCEKTLSRHYQLFISFFHGTARFVMLMCCWWGDFFTDL